MSKKYFTFAGIMTKTKQILGVLVLAWIATSNSWAQPTAPVSDDFMASTGKIYVVVAVLGIILLGIFFFLIRMDRRLGRIEQQQKD